jgi:V8-like Glu-specific endopeptidase
MKVIKMLSSPQSLNGEIMGQAYLFLTFFFAISANAQLVQLPQNSQAIYGSDDRSFIDASTNLKIAEISKSVAMIIDQDSLNKKYFHSFVKAGTLTDTSGVNLCLDEKFAKHHSLNSCTGFLVGPDLIASAGHCFMTKEDCDRKKIIFNVRVDNENEQGYKVSNNAVYDCSEIIKTEFDSQSNQDYSLIRLKRKVTGRLPLKLRSTGMLQATDKVFMIGYPLGLPQVFSAATAINDNADAHFFKATLDSFEGNSGSPVINARTLEVEGLLVRGEDDFVMDNKTNCLRNAVYNEGSQSIPSDKGEGVSRISEIYPLDK